MTIKIPHPEKGREAPVSKDARRWSSQSRHYPGAGLERNLGETALPPCRRAFEVERQQPRQRVFLGDILRPAIGGRDRPVEIAMRVVEPRRALVVEIGQRALFEHRGGPGIHRQDAVGIARHDLRHAPHEVGRVQPRLAQFVEPLRRLGDRDRARVLCVCSAGMFGVSPSGRGRSRRLWSACSGDRFRRRASTKPQ